MSTPGQAVGGLVGAVAGFFLGGGPMGAVYGAQAGLMLGGMLDPPKGPTIDGPGLDDLTVQTSTYGSVIPRVYGTVAVAGNVFWLENNRLKETITKKSAGGKGGRSKTTTRVRTYSATFAVGLCKGPIVGVRRIWLRGQLYYDAGSSDPATIVASNQAATGFHVYLGTDTQSPDARMQATLGVANTPAWRGLAYLVFYDLQLEKYSNSLMGAQVRVEVFGAGAYTSTWQLGQMAYIDGKEQMVCAFAPWGGIAIAYYWSSPDTNGYGFTSDHGITWVRRSFPLSFVQVNIGSYGSRICVHGYVQGSGIGLTLVTSDGVNWTQASYGTYRSLGPICCNGTVWCIGGYGYVKISADNCLSWTEYALPSTNSVTCCINHNNRLIVAGDSITGSGIYYTSDNNGVNWTQRELGLGTTQGITKAASNGSLIVAIVLGRRTISYDAGNTWSTLTDFVSGKTNWQSILYGSGVFVVFNGIVESPPYGNYAIAADPTGPFTYYNITGNTTGFYYGVAYTGSKFCCVQTNSGQQTYVVTPVISPAPDALANIVRAECLQSGLLTSGDIDVIALTQSVRGYAVGTVGSIRSALEPLQAGWPFDVRQHGYKIQFVPRGGSSVVTIPASDLDARDSGAEPGVQIIISREMDSQLPRRVTVNYLDADREYNRGTQYAERLTTPSINALTLDLPIVLTSTEGAGKAEVLLYLYWLERHDVSITLPPTYNQLESGDVVTLATPEGNVTLRLTAVNYTSDGRVECKAKYASAAIYTPTAVAASPAVTGPTTITPVGASVYALLDIPQISTAQSGPSFLAAMTGALSGWDGGVLMQSTDAGATWAQLQGFDPPGSTLGTASNSLGVVDSRVIDSGSVLNVTLTQGALYSVTQLAMFSGQNLFAYGADGRWEIIAAQTCTLVSGTSYALRDLLRGRFGSEWAMGLHAAGDTIVLLDTTDVALIAMGSGTIGLSYLYRGITVDRDIGTDSNRSFTYQAVNLKPLSPIALAGARDPSSNDWTLTWIRRTREGGEWRDNVDASLGESSQVYQIDVFSDGTYATVKRTITTSTPDASYSSADQVTDFGANQATLYLKIYQLSSVVGRGYPLTQSLTG